MNEGNIVFYKKVIEKLTDFLNQKQENTLFKETLQKNLQELENNINELKKIEELFYQNNLKIAFVGQVGVGKSSIISSLLPKIKLNSKELYETDKTDKNKIKRKIKISNDKFLKKSALLPVGDGRTTLAQIIILLRKNIQDYELTIEMQSEKEVKETIDNYLEYFTISDEERKNYQLMPSELRSYLYNKVLKKYVIKNINPNLTKRHEIEENFKKYLKKQNRNIINQVKAELLALIFKKIHTDETFIRIKYTDNNLNNFFLKNKLYKDFILESRQNKQLRFIKEVLKKINNGKLSFVTIPKKIELYIPNSENLTIIDTKGTEKYNKNTILRDSYYINSDIEKMSKDDSIITIFTSSLEDAPSFDIKEIFSEESLKENFMYKSGLLISLKKDIDYETYEKKLSDCMIEMPELKDTTAFYNAYLNFFNSTPEMAFDNKSFFDYVHIINTKRLMHLQDKKQLLKKVIEDKIYLFQNALTESEYKKIEKFVEIIRNEKPIIIEDLTSKIENIYTELINMLKNTHHSIIYAMTRRCGEYSGFDLLTYMRVKADNYINALYKLIDKKIDDELKKSKLKKEVKEKVNRVFKAFFIKEKNELKNNTYEYIDNFKNNEVFWQETISEWGKGTGYKHRVINRFVQNKEFKNFQIFIEEQFKNALILELLDNFLPLFSNEQEKKNVFTK